MSMNKILKNIFVIYLALCSLIGSAEVGRIIGFGRAIGVLIAMIFLVFVVWDNINSKSSAR